MVRVPCCLLRFSADSRIFRLKLLETAETVSRVHRIIESADTVTHTSTNGTRRFAFSLLFSASNFFPQKVGFRRIRNPLLVKECVRRTWNSGIKNAQKTSVANPDPGSGMGKKSGSGSGKINPCHVSESIEINFLGHT
jgi:hypothetical protein